MMQLTFDLTTLTPKTTRKPDPIYEKKRLMIPKFLTLINSQVKAPYKPLTEMQFKIRMNDAGYVSVESWYTLLAELKQSSKPGALWGFKMKK